MEGDPELLDVLCELADDHDSTLIEKPFSDEDDTVDEDSILGTQRSKASQASISLTQRESNRDSSESDEDDRETLEMSQIFCLDDLSDLPAGYFILSDFPKEKKKKKNIHILSRCFPILQVQMQRRLTSHKVYLSSIYYFYFLICYRILLDSLRLFTTIWKSFGIIKNY